MATDAKKNKSDEDVKELLKNAQEAFERCQQAENDNRQKAKFDLKFARNDEQWPEHIKRDRELDGRPCLTLNKLKPVIKQIVNDGRQNKPQITVHPRDSDSDPTVATIINGIIRQIEQGSAAEDAYDTALDHTVTMGFGFIRVNTKYAHDDTFDQDIVIQRVADPFTIYGDPDSTSLDGSDWNVAFVTESIPIDTFEARYPDAKATDWDHDYKDCGAVWKDGDSVTVAEYWTRERATRTIVKLSNDETMGEDVYEFQADFLAAQDITVVDTREVETWKVMLRIISGAEVLEEREWGGRHIPIVPVYGEEIFIDGVRHLQGIVRSAIPAQQNYNYWRTNATEAVALAPLAPWIGPKGAFETDAEKWATANRQPHAYIEYDIIGQDGKDIAAPQRTIQSQIPAGAIQQAAEAADDIRAITGLHEASLGAPSNETSGKAISLRQHEGDVATFHFVDNLSKSIRQLGRIVLELIPTVYSGKRIIRVLGEDGTPSMVPVNQPSVMTPQGPQPIPQGMQPHIDPNIVKVFDLTAGKYDCVVKVGPAFSTQREETANQMMQFVQAFPQAAPIVGDLLAKNLDWPGADELARRLQAMLPPQVQGDNPQLDQAKQLIQKMQQQLQAQSQQIAQLKGDQTVKIAGAGIDAYEAYTDRLQAEAAILKDSVAYGLDPNGVFSIVGQSALGGMTIPGAGPMAAPSQMPGQSPFGNPMQQPGPPFGMPAPAAGPMPPPGFQPGNPAHF